jgi:agmatinase
VYTRDVQPVWSGIPTFLRAPYVDFDEVQPGSVAVAGVPWDATCGSRPGTRYGPRGIREASLHVAYELQSAGPGGLVDIATGDPIRLPDPRKLVDVGDFNTYPADLERSTQSIRDGMYHLTERGAFPIALGGDHYVTYPLCRGFAEAACSRGARKIGYIQIDHHLDLHDRNLVWGTHWHGSNSRRVSELEMIDPTNMCWIGPTGFVRTEQYAYIRKAGLNVFTMKSIREMGIAEVTRRALEAASRGTDAVYVTIDIDSIDVSYAPGTGGTSTDGLTALEFLEVCTILGEAPNVGAVDLVEVDSTVDPPAMTARLAVLGLARIIGARTAGGAR